MSSPTSRYPNQKSAQQQGFENLSKPVIRAFINAQLDDHWKRLHMGGDEALALTAGDARSDIRMLFNAEGVLLKPHEWPDEIANSVEAVDWAGGSLRCKAGSHRGREVSLGVAAPFGLHATLQAGAHLPSVSLPLD